MNVNPFSLGPDAKPPLREGQGRHRARMTWRHANDHVIPSVICFRYVCQGGKFGTVRWVPFIAHKYVLRLDARPPRSTVVGK